MDSLKTHSLAMDSLVFDCLKTDFFKKDCLVTDSLEMDSFKRYLERILSNQLCFDLMVIVTTRMC